MRSPAGFCRTNTPRGRLPGDSYSWSLSFDYRATNNMTAMIRYLGDNNQRYDKILHNLRRSFKYIFKLFRPIILCCIAAALPVSEPVNAQRDTSVVRTVRFEGNERFSSGALSRALDLRLPVRMDSARAAGIAGRLTELYRANGMLFFEVAGMNIGAGGADANLLEISLSEGPLFRTGSISFGGIDSALSAEAESFLPARGTVLYPGLMEEKLYEYLEHMADAGYPFLVAEVDDIRIDSREGNEAFVDYAIRFQNADITRIDSVVVAGSDYTIDRVIIRESRLREGDILRKRSLDRRGSTSGISIILPEYSSPGYSARTAALLLSCP